jgi:flavin reductase (DIM6/NTAB) family NADH-FMN oxidoreductase RutF
MNTDWKEVFTKIDAGSVELKIFEKIDKEWFLITACDGEKTNTMTASWGTMGTLWNKPVIICFIRPTRYTFSIMEEADVFTVSFLNKDHKKILNYCGSKSGSSVDKIKETGLLPVNLENGGISFEQANLVFECKKIYFDDIKPIFIIPEDVDEKTYPEKDYHRMYIGEVISVYNKKA